MEFFDRIPPAHSGFSGGRRVASRIIVLALLFLAPDRLAASGAITIQNGSCAVTFDPATLAVNMRSGGLPETLVSTAQPNLGGVAGLEKGSTRAQWSLPEEKVSITFELDGSRLLAHFLAQEPGES